MALRLQSNSYLLSALGSFSIRKTISYDDWPRLKYRFAIGVNFQFDFNQITCMFIRQ